MSDVHPDCTNGPVDLIGGPFAVIESDPDVFTSLVRKLGITGVEIEEVCDIQPWTLNNLKSKGLIFCFTWNDKYRTSNSLDPAANDVWFANQLSDDACGSLAVLNILFNSPDVELGEELLAFKSETMDMTPEMRGLAISNFKRLREAQNSLARPADLRGALCTISQSTRDAEKSPTRKRSKTKRTEWSGKKKGTKSKSSKSKKAAQEDDVLDSYHFVGYVPAYGKVWELDGLGAGPLEVGELESVNSTDGWEDIVRPALLLKMERYGAASGFDAGGDIQFNLLALVQDKYEAKSDELELLKREKTVIERQLEETYGMEWSSKVNEDLLESATEVFTTQAHPASHGPVYARDFGARKMAKDLAVLQMPSEDLPGAWEGCLLTAITAKIAVDEEIQKSARASSDAIKRTHDYEPFIREFITALHTEGLLRELLIENGGT